MDWDYPATEPPSYLLRFHPEIYQQEQELVTRRFEEAAQQVEAQHDGLAEQRRTEDIARTLGIEVAGDLEAERFQRIMQRAARDNDRDRENDRER